jgi:hypothetical protein
MEKTQETPVKELKDFLIKIFSSRKKQVYVPGEGMKEGFVDNEQIDLSNRARFSLNKFVSMSQYPEALVIAGNPRSNGMASAVAYEIKDDYPMLDANPENYEDKYGNILFGMLFKRKQEDE